jgi:hypothetical protein
MLSSENKLVIKVDIEKMLEFFIDNIFVVLGNQVLQQSVGIPMGSNCAPCWLTCFYIYMKQNSFRDFEQTRKSLML